MRRPDVRDLRSYVYIIHLPPVPAAYARPHAVAIPVYAGRLARLSQARCARAQLRHDELRSVTRRVPILYQAQKGTDR